MAADMKVMLEEGMRQHRAGRLDEAEARYRAVLAENPRDANAASMLGLVALARGAVEAAVRLTAQAFQLRPDSAIFAANLGTALATAGQTERAIELFAAAARQRPDDATLLRNLGTALNRIGRNAEALAQLDRAVGLAPEDAETHLARAHALKDLGRRVEALAATDSALADPDLPQSLAEQARFLHAALAPEEGVPERAPAAYVRELFELSAFRFDAELRELGYQTPDLIAALLEEELGRPAQAWKVIDLGCGTGLSGVALRPFAADMVGIDLSPRMLAAARARHCYDMLLEGDLLELLPTLPAESFDLVAAADVLNYFGDLYPALAAIARRLKPGGALVFSTEAPLEGQAAGAGAGTGYTLGSGLRFRHDPAHVDELAADAGLVLKARRRAVLRREGQDEVLGDLHLYLLG